MATDKTDTAQGADRPDATVKASTKKSASSKKTSTNAVSAKKHTVSSRSDSTRKHRSIGLQERSHMIEVAAYYLAERNGFIGNPVDYWTAAESQIAQQLGS
jgi:hypothetical protein